MCVCIILFLLFDVAQIEAGELASFVDGAVQFYCEAVLNIFLSCNLND